MDVLREGEGEGEGEGNERGYTREREREKAVDNVLTKLSTMMSFYSHKKYDKPKLKAPLLFQVHV